MLILDRRFFKLYSDISFPSTYMLPLLIGYIENKMFKIELFPEPVLPQIAIFSPTPILKLKFFRARDSPSSYESSTFLKIIWFF